MVGDYIVRTNTNKVVLGVNSQKVIEGSVEYFNVFNNDIINIKEHITIKINTISTKQAI